MCHFDDKYFADDPADGGERAAVDLSAAVQQYLRSLNLPLVNVPVIGRAFASWEGLSSLFAKLGIAKNSGAEQVVPRFTRGFSHPGAFRQFVKNPTCRHILLVAMTMAMSE